MKKITLPQLKKIIAEELKLSLTEAVDHKSVANVATAASKLLTAVEAFKKTASASMINAMTPHLGEVEEVLSSMIEAPGSYVEQPKPAVKKVSLKPAAPEKMV